MNGNRPDWFPDWTGECVAIVGAGPSVKREDVAKLQDRIHVVAINKSYELCRWADILYSCDDGWWNLAQGAKDFSGLKITQDAGLLPSFPDIKRIQIRGAKNHHCCHDFLMEKWGEIGGGGNGGYQMLNFSAQLGATGIMLIGFDFCAHNLHMHPHWHGRHPLPLHNPVQVNFDKWRTTMENAAPTIAKLGIDVVNCSQISVLNCFPKMSVDDALKRWSL